MKKLKRINLNTVNWQAQLLLQEPEDPDDVTADKDVTGSGYQVGRQFNFLPDQAGAVPQTDAGQVAILPERCMVAMYGNPLSVAANNPFKHYTLLTHRNSPSCKFEYLGPLLTELSKALSLCCLAC